MTEEIAHSWATSIHTFVLWIIVCQAHMPSTRVTTDTPVASRMTTIFGLQYPHVGRETMVIREQMGVT